MTDPTKPSSLPGPLTLLFRPGADPDASARIESWMNGLQQEFSGRVHAEKDRPADSVLGPSLTIPGARRSRISYHFVPEGHEQDAFLDLLQTAIERDAAMRPADGLSSTDATPGVEMLLFVANQCPNCPRAVRTAHALALDPEVPDLHVHLFEATQSPGLAERHQVKSVPTLLIPGTFRLVGPPDADKLRALLRSADSGDWLREQIRQEIRGGQAPEAGRRIAEMDDPSFLIADLERSTFQERIGLLLALEEALENRPGCLDDLAPRIAALLDTAETSLRGDLAALLGTIGRPEALPALERLLEDPNPDVVEAAEDAIEEIREKTDS